MRKPRVSRKDFLSFEGEGREREGKVVLFDQELRRASGLSSEDQQPSVGGFGVGEYRNVISLMGQPSSQHPDVSSSEGSFLRSCLLARELTGPARLTLKGGCNNV